MADVRDAPYLYADRWERAARYASSLSSRAQRRYAAGYVQYLRGGATGLPPERGRLPWRTSVAIREALDAMQLWGP